jgi:hypothetical protein
MSSMENGDSVLNTKMSPAASPARTAAGGRSSVQRERLDRVQLPPKSNAGAIRNVSIAVLDPQRLLKDRIGPVDILQVMGAGRRGKKVHADLRQQMRRHHDSPRCGKAGGVDPTAHAADASDIRHHVIAGSGGERLEHRFRSVEVLSDLHRNSRGIALEIFMTREALA